MSTCAVIPVKRLDNAKQRLGDLLTGSERSALFRAMVRDVIKAGVSCALIDRVVVVTSDAEAAALAQAAGAETLPESAEPGLIAAVTHAATWLAQAGAATMVFLPGDIPLVTAAELTLMLQEPLGPEPSMTIAPAADLGGSNCVVTSPPDCMTFGFGEDSFRRHLRLARQVGIEPAVLRLPGIGLDIDTKADLVALVAELQVATDAAPNTARYLVESGILARLENARLDAG